VDGRSNHHDRKGCTGRLARLTFGLLLRLREVFSFSETLLQPDPTGNVRESINPISEYDKSVFRVIRKEFLAFTPCNSGGALYKYPRTGIDISCPVSILEGRTSAVLILAGEEQSRRRVARERSAFTDHSVSEGPSKGKSNYWRSHDERVYRPR
jgi:hypothetical protein